MFFRFYSRTFFSDLLTKTSSLVDASPLRNKQWQAVHKRPCTVCRGLSWHAIQRGTPLSKVCVSSNSVVSHSGQGILSWRWCSSGEMTGWRDMRWALWFRTTSTFPVLLVVSVVKLWRKLWGGPMVLLSLCHPELSPHPYTSRCTWQLGPAGTCAPMACRESAPRRTEAWQPPLFILWLTWVGGLPECLCHHQNQHKNLVSSLWLGSASYKVSHFGHQSQSSRVVKLNKLSRFSREALKTVLPGWQFITSQH